MRKLGNGGKLMLEKLAQPLGPKVTGTDLLIAGLEEAAAGVCVPIKEDGSHMTSDVMASYFVLEMLGIINIGGLKPGKKLSLTDYGREVYKTIKSEGK